MYAAALFAFVVALLDVLNVLPGMGARIVLLLVVTLLLYVLYEGDQLNRVKLMVRGVGRKVGNTSQGQGKTKKQSPKSQPNAKPDYRVIAWHGLTLRSQSEVKIAKALDNQGLMFLAGARVRLKTEGHRQTREVDFLIQYQGRWGILEVDGPHHQHSVQADEWRDARFREHGIPVMRFPADLCYRQPEAVIATFLKQLNEFLPLPTITSALPPEP